MHLISIEIFNVVGFKSRGLQGLNLVEFIISLISEVASIFYSFVIQFFSVGVTLLTEPSALDQSLEEAIINVGVEIVTSVVNIIADVQPDILTDIMQESIDINDPICLEMNSRAREFHNNTNCVISYDLYSMQLSGTSNAKLDDLELNDFNYEDNNLFMNIVGTLQFQTLFLNFYGILSSIDDCQGPNQPFQVTSTITSPTLAFDAIISALVTAGDYDITNLNFTKFELLNTDFMLDLSDLGNYSSLEIENAFRNNMSDVMDFLLDDVPKQFLECTSYANCFNASTPDDIFSLKY